MEIIKFYSGGHFSIPGVFRSMERCKMVYRLVDHREKYGAARALSAFQEYEMEIDEKFTVPYMCIYETGSGPALHEYAELANRKHFAQAERFNTDIYKIGEEYYLANGERIAEKDVQAILGGEAHLESSGTFFVEYRPFPAYLPHQ